MWIFHPFLPNFLLNKCYHSHMKKQLAGEGNYHPSSIILRRDTNIVPPKKIPEPWPPHRERAVTTHSATAQPEGGTQDVTRERA
jgi:hypothetical protein